jgi:hypothetical protein
MGIISHISGLLADTVVYWGSPVNDGRGKYTFAAPEELKVRWEDEIENFAKDTRSRIQIGKDGREYRPNAIIYTVNVPSTGWNLDGYIYLGTLDSINSETDPYSVNNAHEIKQINTISEVRNKDSKLYVIYI